MVGDSADPLIASAAAFGARDFDRRAALAAMLRGARRRTAAAPTANTSSARAWRPYSALGYVPFDLDTNVRNANSIYGDPDDVWGSAATTLEYTLDDFAIAQFAARALRRPCDLPSLHAALRQLAQALRPPQPHDRAALRKRSLPVSTTTTCAGAASSRATRSSTAGWSPTIPLASFGRSAAEARPARACDALSAQAQRRAGRDPRRSRPARQRADSARPLALRLDWGSPTGRRQPCAAACGLYGTGPAGYPGNDDLGTLSSWYVLRRPRSLSGGPGRRPAGDRQPTLPRSASLALAHRRRPDHLHSRPGPVHRTR